MQTRILKTAAALLAVCVLIGVIPFTPETGAATLIGSGACGDAAFWSLDDAGVLRITGSGAMRDFIHRYDYYDGYTDYEGDGKDHTRYNSSRETVTASWGTYVYDLNDPMYVAEEQSGKRVLYECPEDFWIEAYCFCDVPWYAVRDRIRSVVIAEGITYIGEYAFFHCGAETVSVPESVREIGKCAFAGCEALQSVSLPGALTELRDFMFDGCSRLRTAALPDRLTRVGAACFRGCTLLTALQVPSGVGEIGAYAFANCATLTELSLPESVRKLGKATFSGCESLLRFIFPAGLTEIPESVLQGCGALIAAELPGSVAAVGENAFADCVSLTEISLPGSLKTLPKGMLRGCAALTTAEIPAGVEVVEDRAFSGCSALAVLYLPLSLTKIGESAFEGCTHQKVVYYGGSLQNWLAVELGAQNDALSSAFLFRFEETPDHEHDLRAVPARAATCSTYGLTACYLCSLCGRYYADAEAATRVRLAEITLPPLPHTLAEDRGTPATCTEKGVSDGAHCTVCGRVTAAQTTLQAKGHRWGVGEVVKEAGCTEPGVRAFTCTVCGHRQEQPIFATGHKIEWRNEKPATCTEPGAYGHYECIICGKTYAEWQQNWNRENDVTIPPLGHSIKPVYGDGVWTRTCERCGLVETVLLGDVDGSGVVTAADARLALRRAVGLENYNMWSKPFLGCDVTLDRKITAEDARLILRAAVGLESFVQE